MNSARPRTGELADIKCNPRQDEQKHCVTVLSRLITLPVSRSYETGLTKSCRCMVVFRYFVGRLKSARPPSARPAAPRLKEKTEVLAEEEVQAR